MNNIYCKTFKALKCGVVLFLIVNNLILLLREDNSQNTYSIVLL